VRLYYVDDTLLLAPRDAKSLVTLKFLLSATEMMTGLKINFHKSFIYNLNRDMDIGRRATSILNCKVVSFPFSYLGHPIKMRPLDRGDCLFLTELKNGLPLGKASLSLRVVS